MEYCSEGTLVDFMKIREASMLSEPEVLYFFHEICMGVASMHAQTPKIVHRDLKVENVLITNTQKLKLCDFGSSTTELIAPGSAINVARAQVLEDELAACTTMQYRAPEMLDLFQRRGLTEKLDIWALGVLLYKLCYFKTPFDDEGPLAILNCRYSFPPNPIYSPPLLHLIRSMLQENPDQRPSVEKIIINVCQIRGVQPTVTEPSPVIPPKTPEPLKDSIRPATILAPTTSQPGPLFNADVITPMRRGRPTRQKPASTPDNTLNPLPANAFVSPAADPFEMIAAGLNLPATSGGSSPWDVFNSEPDSRGSFWNNPSMASSQKNNLKAEPIHPDNPVPPIPPPKPRSLMSNTPQYLAGMAPPKPPRHRNHSPANRNY